MGTPQDLPSGYHFKEGNLFVGNNDRPISNFYLTPSQVYCVNGNTLPSFADIEIVQSGSSVPLSQHTALSKLTPQWWKNPPPGCVFYPESWGAPQHLRTLFGLLLAQLEPVAIFQPNRLGWTKIPPGKPVYITGSGGIGADGFLPPEQVWIPSELKDYRLEQASEVPIEGALDYFWKLFWAIPGITDILVVNALSSILFPFFKLAGIESRFPLILEGPSEAKKTTLACLTSSLYNRKSTPCGSVVTLTSTQRALERRGVYLRHATIIFDDLFPDGRNALERKALGLIRDIANQRPREARSGKTLTSAVMECGAVLTAEYFPDCGLSTRTRCLRLVLAEHIPSSTLTPFQETPELLGTVIAEFISHVAAKFDEIATDIKADFQSYRIQRAQKDASPVKSERLAEIGFVLCKTLHIFMEIFPLDVEIRDKILESFQSWVNYRLDWQLSPEASPKSDIVIALLPRIIKENRALR